MRAANKNAQAKTSTRKSARAHKPVQAETRSGRITHTQGIVRNSSFELFRIPMASAAVENAIAAQTEDKPPIKANCLECGHNWEIDRESTKTENVICPNCGAWCIVRLHPDRERYTRGLGTTAGGNDTLDINDAIARDLRGLSVKEVYEHAARTMVEAVLVHGVAVLPKSVKKAMKTDRPAAEDLFEYFDNKYAARNPGMQRMNVGNLLRTLGKNAAEIAATKI